MIRKGGKVLIPIMSAEDAALCGEECEIHRAAGSKVRGSKPFPRPGEQGWAGAVAAIHFLQQPCLK